MRLFLDTANVEAVRRLVATGCVHGVTTNPTHLSKEGGDPLTIVKELCTILAPYGEVCVQVTEREPKVMGEQARRIAKIAENVVVKVPCLPEYFPIIDELTLDEVPVNMTLVFSVAQAVALADLGVAMVSPFLGRLDDSGASGIDVLNNIVKTFKMFMYETEVLAASIRSVEQMEKAAVVGADIVTLSPQLFEQALKHPLSEKGFEQFTTDWAKLGVRQFP